MRRHSSVLVIDDEEVMREILESLLTADGHRVTTAGTGEEGLALARSSSFDAAVVDVMLPGIDGIETLQELKKLDDELPVVLVTAFASVETAIAAMKRGAWRRNSGGVTCRSLRSTASGSLPGARPVRFATRKTCVSTAIQPAPAGPATGSSGRTSGTRPTSSPTSMDRASGR